MMACQLAPLPHSRIVLGVTVSKLTMWSVWKGRTQTQDSEAGRWHVMKSEPLSLADN